MKQRRTNALQNDGTKPWKHVLSDEYLAKNGLPEIIDHVTTSGMLRSRIERLAFQHAAAMFIRMSAPGTPENKWQKDNKTAVADGLHTLFGALDDAAHNRVSEGLDFVLQALEYKKKNPNSPATSGVRMAAERQRTEDAPPTSDNASSTPSPLVAVNKQDIGGTSMPEKSAQASKEKTTKSAQQASLSLVERAKEGLLPDPEAEDLMITLVERCAK